MHKLDNYRASTEAIYYIPSASLLNAVTLKKFLREIAFSYVSGNTPQ
jgi:hypothetical protein